MSDKDTAEPDPRTIDEFALTNQPGSPVFESESIGEITSDHLGHAGRPSLASKTQSPTTMSRFRLVFFDIEIADPKCPAKSTFSNSHCKLHLGGLKTYGRRVIALA